MSGIDEQDADIPVCPVCRKKPLFWSLYPTTDGNVEEGGIWLFSDTHTRPASLDKLANNGFSDLNAIRSVKCRPVKFDIQKRHVFEEDSKVFNAVMRIARRERK